MRSAVWFLVVAAFALYMVMALWSLPYIAIEAGGQRPFDMRPFGYSEAEARAFVAGLSDAGKMFYLGTQHTLDAIYPALLGAAMMLGCALLFASWVKYPFLILSLVMVLADYQENQKVAEMLIAGEAGMTAAMVQSASTWTVIKSMSATVVFVALIAALITKLVTRRKRSA